MACPLIHSMITYACILQGNTLHPLVSPLGSIMGSTMQDGNGSLSVVGSGSALVSRNVTVAGHRTSVRLEPAMWVALQEICRRERCSLHEVCTQIAAQRQSGASLTAAIRVFIMAYFRAAATDDGHRRAGHGSGAADGVLATLPVMHSVMPSQPVRR